MNIINYIAEDNTIRRAGSDGEELLKKQLFQKVEKLVKQSVKDGVKSHNGNRTRLLE